jgi:protease-4
LIANGKVWTGEQAYSMKLVDQLADFEEAVKDTAKAVGIQGEPSLVWPPKSRRSGLDLIFGDVSDYLPTREKLLEQQVGFYYLWK